MAKGNREEKYAYLDRLSTEQLEELLRADFESSDSGDNGVIFHILEVIEKREDEHPTGRLPDKDKSWEEFQQYYNIPEGEGMSLYPTHSLDGTLAEGGQGSATSGWTQSKRLLRLRHMIKVAGIAAILVAVIFGTLITVQAAGIDVFGAIGRWTEETFHFVTAPGGAVSKETVITPSPENIGYYNSLQAALDQCGITGALVPTWYPKFAEASEPQIFNDAISDCVNFYLSFGDEKFLSIDITQYHYTSDLESLTFEKDSASVEQYTSGAKTFYILSNLDTITATWSDGLLVESIVSNVSKDEVKVIIDSIGGV